MTASVFRSSADRVWTADRLALSAEGNAEGLDSETIVWGIVSKQTLAMVFYFGKSPQASPQVLTRSHTLVASSADRAVQNRIRISSGFPQQIATIGAENQ